MDVIYRVKLALDKGAFKPGFAHADDAGMDLKSPVDVTIVPGKSVVIDTGVHIEIPKGYAGFLKSKSGLNVNHGITGEGIIDVGYTGSIKAKLYNNSHENYHVCRGDKIIQLVIIPCIQPIFEIVDRLDDSERGANGFGSTGR